MVRPDWSATRNKSGNDVKRVIQKLKDIGVHDTWELVRRVQTHSINEAFTDAGHNRFSKETLESIKRQSAFVRALDHLKEPYYRQVGLFAPVSQLFTGTNLRVKAEKLSRAAGPDMTEHIGVRPATSGAWNAEGSGNVGGQMSEDFDQTLRPNTVECAMRPRTSSENSCCSGFAEMSATACLGGLHGSASSPELSSSAKNARHELFLRHPSAPGKSRHNKVRSRGSNPLNLNALLGSNESSRPGTPTNGDDMFSSPLSRSQTLSRGSSPPRSPLDASMWKENSPRVLGLGARSPAASWSWAVDDFDSDEALPAGWCETWTMAGDQMKQEPWLAKWGSGRSPLYKSHAMLREQSALDERKALARAISLEGSVSPLHRKGISPIRAHVTRQIRSRMQEEYELDKAGAHTDHQRCINIRKQLGNMQTARRDFCELKRKAQEAIEPPMARTRSEPAPFLTAESFHRASNFAYDMMEEIKADNKER